MRRQHTILPGVAVSNVKRYRYRLIMNIALVWTILDVISELTGLQVLSFERAYTPYDYNGVRAFFVKEFSVWVMSVVMAYLMVVNLKRMFGRQPFWVTLFARSLMLLLASFLMNFIIHFLHSTIILQMQFGPAVRQFISDALYTNWVFHKVPYWLLLFILTQLIIEINEKYAPGVFLDVLMGKYAEPVIEKRIVMFLDLKDSTPIAEKLGHPLYFKFIRDFIHYMSYALIEYGGRIYQYVGDEIVVSWLFTPENTRKCMDSLIEARRNLQKHGEHFRRMYGVLPEFRVGIHVGDVTVGEIGVVKRDLAMSGDTMNTTARIRSACSELNQKFIVSKEFLDNLDLKTWQSESLGFVDLKGKQNAIELFALKI